MVAFALCFALILIVAALVLLGMDLTESLEMHGILASATLSDLLNMCGVDSAHLLRRISAVLPETGRGAAAWVFGIYAWVFPALAGIVLLFLGVIGSRFRRR